MKLHSKAAALSCIALASLCACGGPPTNGEPSLNGGTESTPVSVTHRVRIGGDDWLIEPGAGSPIVRAGTIESFEIVNDTSEDLVPDVGLGGNTTFRIIVNTCPEGVKPGRTCIVRGEWLAGGPRDVTLDVAVTNKSAPSKPTKKISVPLEAASGSATPTKKTVAPTPVSTATTSTSPSATSTTGTPTPTPSTTTSVTSPPPTTAAPTASATKSAS